MDAAEEKSRSRRSRKMGDSPLAGGGALDWIGEGEPTEKETSTEGPESARSVDNKEELEGSERRGGAQKSREGEEPSPGASPGGEGLRPGFRRHTLIMREDHIEKVNRLTTLEKLRSGGKLKKDVVAEIFEWYFREHSDALSLDETP